VLLDEEHRRPLRVGGIANGLEEALDDERSEAHRQLVSQQHAWLPAELPRQAEHLLLAARQQATADVETAFQLREQLRLSL
jgi:hypothetical protein